MIIALYIYDKKSCAYLYTDIGNPEYVINDLGDDKDFTTIAPPDNTKTWYWIDKKWTENPTAP